VRLRDSALMESVKPKVSRDPFGASRRRVPRGSLLRQAQGGGCHPRRSTSLPALLPEETSHPSAFLAKVQGIPPAFLDTTDFMPIKRHLIAS